MKRLFAPLFSLVFAILTGLCIAACSSLPIPLPTLAQQFQAGCTVVNGDLTFLSTSPLLTPAQKELIVGVPGDATKPGILPTNLAICKAGGQLNVADLRTVHDSLLPMAITIVEAIPAVPNQQLVLLGLQTFGPLVQAQIDLLITAVTPAPASAVPAASAPVPASS